MHNLLKRQIKKFFGDKFKPKGKLRLFFESVNNAYNDFDYDRKLLERSLDISSEEMTNAIKKANEANEVKSLFLANMSHEIRTPLNGVIGMLELLKDSDLKEKQEYYARTASASAETLLSLINDILDFSKMEAGKLFLEKVTFDFPTWFNTTIELMNVHAVTKNIELVGEIKGDIPKIIIGDSNRLRQILINLIGNAIKFTDAKGGVLVIVEHKVIGAEIELIFSVSDSGIGIKEEKTSQIYNAFEQEDLSTTRKYGGTGLGLSISKNLVQQMQGELTFVSKLNVGTTFKFNVLLEKGDDNKIWYEASSPLDKSLQSTKALIISNMDNSSNNLILPLEKWGMKVDLIKTDKFYDSCNKDDLKYDIILLNLNYDEISISSKLVPDLKNKLSEINKDTPVLFLTPAYMTDLPEVFKELNFHTESRTATLANLFDTIISVLSKKSQNFSQKEAKRILIAEDNPINQKLASIILEKSGYKVFIANDGEEACTLNKKENFDLILMDVQMPVMSGTEAARIIRQDQNSKIPIVALTAHVMEKDRNECLDAGMNAFLSKPFKKHELILVIEENLNKQKKQ